jgi:hypothetical protein
MRNLGEAIQIAFLVATSCLWFSSSIQACADIIKTGGPLPARLTPFGLAMLVGLQAFFVVLPG